MPIAEKASLRADSEMAYISSVVGYQFSIFAVGLLTLAIETRPVYSALLLWIYGQECGNPTTELSTLHDTNTTMHIKGM